jgi:hypothetical protein
MHAVYKYDICQTPTYIRHSQHLPISSDVSEEMDRKCKRCRPLKVYNSCYIPGFGKTDMSVQQFHISLIRIERQLPHDELISCN